MAPVETVATLALVYREAWRNCRLDQSVEDDFEVCPGEVSLIAMLGSRLRSEDLALIAVMDEYPALKVIGREIAEWSPPRFEALMHAWPQDPRRELARAKWARPFLERWELVEATMASLEPTAWTRDRREEIALAAEGKVA